MLTSRFDHPRIEAEIDPAFARRATFIYRAILQHRPTRVLDAGCGRGFYVKLLSELDFVKEVVGIDQNMMHLQVARENVGADQRVRLETGDITALKFDDNYFDMVIASEVLEHLPQDQKGVDEFRRVLRPGGIAAISVPCITFPFLWDPLNWLLMNLFGTHVNKDIHWLAGIWADHERLYAPQGLANLFSSNWQILDQQHLLSKCWPLSHFLLYGIGKNLVERCKLKTFSRFSKQQPSVLSKGLARILDLPERLAPSSGNQTKAVNLVLLASKNAA